MLLSIAAAKGQVPQATQACHPSKLTRRPIHTSTAPAERTATVAPETKIVCGSNTITQNFSVPQPTAVPVPPSRSADSSPSARVAFISAAAGVLGALVGASAGFVTAWLKARSDRELETKRLRANLIAAERLRWLQDIRQRFSTLYQHLDMQYNVLKRPTNPQQQAATQQLLDEFSSTVISESNMITLMLNPEKPDQAALRNALDAAQHFMLAVFLQASAGITNFDDQQYRSLKQAAFDAMTRLGVQTWKQVKDLE